MNKCLSAQIVVKWFARTISTFFILTTITFRHGYHSFTKSLSNFFDNCLSIKFKKTDCFIGNFFTSIMLNY